MHYTLRPERLKLRWTCTRALLLTCKRTGELVWIIVSLLLAFFAFEWLTVQAEISHRRYGYKQDIGGASCRDVRHCALSIHTSKSSDHRMRPFARLVHISKASTRRNPEKSGLLLDYYWPVDIQGHNGIYNRGLPLYWWRMGIENRCIRHNPRARNNSRPSVNFRAKGPFDRVYISSVGHFGQLEIINQKKFFSI